jgi:hypothetical protein
VACTIDSIAPLPTEIREVMVQLDRRYGEGDDPRLRDEEIDALLFVNSFYRAPSVIDIERRCLAGTDPASVANSVVFPRWVGLGPDGPQTRFPLYPR